MYRYGPQINRNIAADHLIKIKNRIFSRHYSTILKQFSRFSHPSTAASLLSGSARRMIGSFLYSIKIELNDFCNLKCKMCYVPGGEHRSLQKDKLIDLLNQVRGLGVRIEYSNCLRGHESRGSRKR